MINLNCKIMELLILKNLLSYDCHHVYKFVLNGQLIYILLIFNLLIYCTIFYIYELYQYLK